MQLAVAHEEVQVVIVRPGFVFTRMTSGLNPAPFAVSAEEVGAAIAEGARTGAPVVWVPRKLRWVAAVLRALPASALRRVT
jgi:decaprenylphospho-beta-D-erythro-pentofuranosid-2-ulose 2-reductase